MKKISYPLKINCWRDPLNPVQGAGGEHPHANFKEIFCSQIVSSFKFALFYKSQHESIFEKKICYGDSCRSNTGKRPLSKGYRPLSESCTSLENLMRLGKIAKQKKDKKS